jgi:hypothetical protein
VEAVLAARFVSRSREAYSGKPRERAYRLGSNHRHFAKIVDLPREDQGMIELPLGVDFELGSESMIGRRWSLKEAAQA